MKIYPRLFVPFTNRETDRQVMKTLSPPEVAEVVIIRTQLVLSRLSCRNHSAVVSCDCLLPAMYSVLHSFVLCGIAIALGQAGGVLGGRYNTLYRIIRRLNTPPA